MAAIAAGTLLLSSCSAVGELGREVSGRPTVDGHANKETHGTALDGKPVALAARTLVTAWCQSKNTLEVVVKSAEPGHKDAPKVGTTVDGVPHADITADEDPYHTDAKGDPMGPLPDCDNNKNTP
jgi:hypothetical protein